MSIKNKRYIGIFFSITPPPHSFPPHFPSQFHFLLAPITQPSFFMKAQTFPHHHLTFWEHITFFSPLIKHLQSNYHKNQRSHMYIFVLKHTPPHISDYISYVTKLNCHTFWNIFKKKLITWSKVSLQVDSESVYYYSVHVCVCLQAHISPTSTSRT
jgi:hypothetical protein